MANFGLSIGPWDTLGYVDPDYHRCCRLTNKSDVYSFGVDLTRDKRVIGLVDLVVSKSQSGALDELVDPKLEINVKPLVRDMVWRMVELTFRCLVAEKDDMFNMMEVIDQLWEIKRLGYGGRTKKNLKRISVLIVPIMVPQRPRNCSTIYTLVQPLLFKTSEA